MSGENTEFRLLIGGDTGFGETWHRKSEGKKRIDPITKFGYDYIFEGMRPVLQQSDFLICNLETALVQAGTVSPHNGRKRFMNQGDPYLSPLTWNKFGVRAMTLGNNHSYDMGVEGYEQTLQALQDHQIIPIGGGMNSEEANKPLVLKTGDKSLLIWSCYWYSEHYDKDYNWYADESSPGTNMLNPKDPGKRINDLKEEYPDSFLIVVPHWGENYKWRNKRQKSLGRAMLNAGADMIVGHGAHALQEVEFYRGKWIIYNLGNFIYSVPGRYKKLDCPPWSLIAQLVFGEGELTALRLFPFFCDNRINHYHPIPAKKAEVSKVRKLIRRRGTKAKYRNLIKISSSEKVPCLELKI